MKRAIALAALFVVPFTSAAAQSAGFTGSYSQNFDSLGPTGTTLTTVGSGEWTVWRIGGGANTWTAATGVVAGDLSSGVLVDDTSTAQNGQAPLGLYYNPSVPTFTRYGGVNAGGSLAISDTDRSLGTSPTGVAGTALQLSLTNNSGGTLSSLALGYDTTVLGLPSAPNNHLLGYRFFYSLTGAAGSWIAASGLDTVTAEGDARFTQYAGGGTLNLAGGWNAGSTLLLRWIDDNDFQSSPDQMLAIDNVTVGRAVAPIPEPATWAMMIGGFGAVGGAMRASRRKALVAA